VKLITVLGATEPKHKQHYVHEGKIYDDYFAFLALARALSIPPASIIVIGTEKTRGLLNTELYAIASEIRDNFVLSTDSVDELFEKCLSLIDDDTVLDVTQGFRHMPMTLLLSGIAASSQKRLSGIYYARTANSDCNPSFASCTFEFISLSSYLDRANLNAIVDSFCASYVVPRLRITLRDYAPVEAKLSELSRHLLGNNSDQAIVCARKLLAHLETLHASSISESIRELEAEVRKIVSLSEHSESLRLYGAAKLYFEKDLLLHAVTNLFEAVLAYLDEYVTAQNIPMQYYDFKRRHPHRCSEEKKPYNRRNCLKKGLNEFVKKHPFHPVLNKALQSKLETIDRLRNHSAHAHATEKSDRHYKDRLGESFVFFDRIITG